MTAATVKNPDTFIYASYGDAQTLDPAVAYDNVSWTNMTQFYETLIGYDKADTGSFVPLLATEVPTQANGGISKDGLTYRFHIRQNVHFHNGDVLTPEDVAYSFKRDLVVDPAGGPDWVWYQVFLGLGGSRDDNGKIDVTFNQINSTVTVDGNDVVFHLKDPYAAFLSVLANTWGAIVDKQWVIAQGGWDGTAATWEKYNNPPAGKETLFEKANGTGPYKLTRWDKGNEIVVDRFDGYWGPKPALREGVYKIVNEWSTRKLLLLQGDADAIQVDSTYYPEMDKESGLTVTKNPTLIITSIFFNFDTVTQDNPYVGSGKLDGQGVPANFFADKNVRLGFEYAWDEKTFLQDATNGYDTDPVTPIPFGLPYKDTSIQRPAFDLQKAASYFKQAFGGQLWDNGFKLQISFNTGNKVREIAAKMIAENLAKINPKFQISVTGIQWAQYLNLYKTRQLPLFIIGWAPDYPDPDDYVVPFIASKGAYAGRQSYKNAEADTLIQQAGIATDPAVRKADYYKIQAIYMQDVPSLTIDQRVEKDYFKNWVKGFFFNPMQSTPYDRLKSMSK